MEEKLQKAIYLVIGDYEIGDPVRVLLEEKKPQSIEEFIHLIHEERYNAYKYLLGKDKNTIKAYKEADETYIVSELKKVLEEIIHKLLYSDAEPL